MSVFHRDLRRTVARGAALLAWVLVLGLAPATVGAEEAPAGPGAQTGEYKFDFPADLPFDPAGWTTATDYPPIGDPAAVRVPGRAFTLPWTAYPATLRTEGPNANATQTSTLQNLVYETLVQLHPETETYIPCLARHWKLQTHEDGTQTFTFRIDERARWADGHPVQADDVYYTWWHRVQEDRNDPMSRLTFFEGYEAPKVLDRLTVEVKTKKANWRLFLYFGAGMQIFPAREMAIPGEKYLADFDWKMQTGTGPYVLAMDELKKGESLVMKRRDDWWGKDELWGKNTYNFDRVKFVVIRDLELIYEKFKKGDLDWFEVGEARRWVEDIPKEKIVQLGHVQKRKIYNRRPVGFSGIAFNMKKAPFNDKRVRLAFAHLFNRERLMEKLFYNEYEFTNSTYPSSDWGSGDERPQVVFDPEAAADLLKEAGYAKRDAEGYLVGPDGGRFEVTLEYAAQTWERIWLVVKEDYEAAGIKLNLKLIDPSTLMKKVSERQFTIHFQPWGGIRFPNPETSWKSSLADEDNNNNIVGFKNARVDELCQQYNVAETWEERKRIIREIDTLICEEHPYAFAWHARSDRLLYWDRFGYPKSYVSKYAINPEDSMLLLWWFDEAKDKALKEAIDGVKAIPQGELEVKPWG